MQIIETDGKETHGLKKVMTISGTERITMNIIVEDMETGEKVDYLSTFVYIDELLKMIKLMYKNPTFKTEYQVDFSDDIKKTVKENLAEEKEQAVKQLDWFVENTDKVIEWRLSCKTTKEWDELLVSKNLSEFEKGLACGIIQGYTDAVQTIEENGKWKKLRDIEHMYG